jgi:hypothetical protein
MTPVESTRNTAMQVSERRQLRLVHGDEELAADINRRPRLRA